MQKRILPWEVICCAIILLWVNPSVSQTIGQQYLLGDPQTYFNSLSAHQKNSSFNIALSEAHKYPLTLTRIGKSTLVGRVTDTDGSMFLLKHRVNKTEGFLVPSSTSKTAFKYTTNTSGKLIAEVVSRNEVLCVDFQGYTGKKRHFKPVATPETPATWDPYELESFPSSNKVIYLDMDGYNLPSGTPWNNGVSLNCEPSGFTDIEMLVVYTIVAEDYAPFKVNVTTNEAVYNAADQYAKTRVVITPTSYWSQGGGVALLESFHWGEDLPCWVFTNKLSGVLSCSEAASHEAGHTLDLRHDGQGFTEYYGGHANWAPIMGNSYSSDLTHWSKGDYNNASNTTQDDIAILAGHLNYRDDDHGDNILQATELFYTLEDGIAQVETKNNKGVIEHRTDVDIFHFYLAGGQVDLAVNPRGNPRPNLDMEVQLLDASGTVIRTYENNHNDFTADISFSEVLTAGDYYIQVEGVGTGNPNTGWTDYSSLGQFSISGTIQGIDQKSYDIALADILNMDGKVCGNFLAPEIQVINGGKVDISSFDAEVFIDGASVSQSTITLNVASGASATTTLTAIPLDAFGSKTIEFVLSLPNGITDELPVNNVIERVVETGPGQLMEFSVSAASMDNQLSWEIKEGNTLQESSNAHDYTTKDGQLIQQFCLANSACYAFELENAFLLDLCNLYPAWDAGTIYQIGDQMVYNGIIYEATTQIWAANPVDYAHYYNEVGPCPTPDADDYFTFKNLSTGETITTSTVAQYTSPHLQDFCLDVLTSSSEMTHPSFGFHPNPVIETIYFDTLVESVSLRDTQGILLGKISNTKEFPLPAHLAPGLYVLEINQDGLVHTEKIFVE